MSSDNDLALARRQAIIWTNDGWFTDALGLNELMEFLVNVFIWGLTDNVRIGSDNGLLLYRQQQAII